MSITDQQAIDEMYGIVKGAIDLNTSIFGYAPDVRYPGVPKSTRPDMSKQWIRVSSAIVKDDLAAFANDQRQQLYDADGILTVQLFAPRNVAGSLDPQALSMANAIAAAIRGRGTSGEIWFTNVRVLQQPESDTSYPVNVVARFNYRTITPLSEQESSDVSGLSELTFTGLVNTVNKVFVVTSPLPPTLLLVFGDGALWGAPDDYTLVGSTITTRTAPQTLRILGD